MATVKAAALLIIATLLSACGGGGGGATGGPTSVTFTGTVALGEPLAGATLLILHASSGQGRTAVTDGAGRYSVTFQHPPGSPLYTVQTIGAFAGPSTPVPPYPQLRSLTNQPGGMLNVTPLTNLLVARLLGDRHGFDTLTIALLPPPSDNDIAAARQDVVGYLLQRPNKNDDTLTDPVDASAVADFIRAPFNAAPGDPHDDAIERLAQTMMEGETIEGVEEHMLARSDPPADLTAVLSLEFDANCVAQSNPPFPTGQVRIRLAPPGQITLAGNMTSYSYTLAPGDRVRHYSPPAFQSYWEFDLVGSGTNDILQLRYIARNLLEVVLIRAGGTTPGSISCTPTLLQALGTRIPSTLAKIRALDAAFSNPTPGFTCPVGTTFPGVNNGANSLAIQNNGVLRVAAGYAVHLPSLGAGLDTEVVSDAGALRTRVRTAAFRRGLGLIGVEDSIAVTLDAGGNIESINFAQQRNGGTPVSKDCP